MTMLSSDALAIRAKYIRLLLLDVDGVLTDGKLYFNNEGGEYKAFNTLDGHGIKMLQRSGVEVGLITGRSSKLVTNRASELGINIVMQGREDKLTAVKEVLSEHPYSFENVAFMGDDYPDLAVIRKVGLGLTVPNAHPCVIEYADWQSTRRGGEGAVREACDLIMNAQGTYESSLTPYLQ